MLMVTHNCTSAGTNPLLLEHQARTERRKLGWGGGGNMTEESYEFCLSEDYYSASQASDRFSGLAKPDGGIMTKLSWCLRN
jgi:hypothetical protein